MRKKTDRDRERLDVDFRSAVARLAMVAFSIIRTRRAAVPIGTIFPALRLARAAPVAIPIPVPRSVVPAARGVRFLAFKIRIVVRTRGFTGPRREQAQVEQVLAWSRRRHYSSLRQVRGK